MMEKEEEEIFDMMTRLHFAILELCKKERDRRKEGITEDIAKSKIGRMIEEIKRRKAMRADPQADIERLIQENSALRAELNRALQRLATPPMWQQPVPQPVPVQAELKEVKK